MTFAPANTQTAFLPVEFQVEKEEKLFKELIAKRERLTATILNVKEIAQYELRELLNGQQWFNPGTSQAYSQTSTRMPRYGFRTTFDLVALNGGVIPAGATTLTLTAATIPPLIPFANSLIPTDGYGAATNATEFYFINDPLLFVRTNLMTTAVQQITVTNNTGSDLTQCFWVMEYLKT
jgi:hypothetical protein